MTKDKVFPTAMVALGCIIGMSVIFIIALTISNADTQAKIKEQQEQAFFNKCAAACAPNDVYSIKYNRCTCNASVTVRDVK